MRPQKVRIIENAPTWKNYIPCQGDEIVPQNLTASCNTTQISLDMYEALRLVDCEGLDQNAAALSMEISTPTLCRLLGEGRKRVACALCHGHILQCDGGNVLFRSERGHGCGRGNAQRAMNGNGNGSMHAMRNMNGQCNGMGRMENTINSATCANRTNDAGSSAIAWGADCQASTNPYDNNFSKGQGAGGQCGRGQGRNGQGGKGAGERGQNGQGMGQKGACGNMGMNGNKRQADNAQRGQMNGAAESASQETENSSC